MEEGCKATAAVPHPKELLGRMESVPQAGLLCSRGCRRSLGWAQAARHAGTAVLGCHGLEGAALNSGYALREKATVLYPMSKGAGFGPPK